VDPLSFCLYLFLCQFPSSWAIRDQLDDEGRGRTPVWAALALLMAFRFLVFLHLNSTALQRGVCGGA